MLLPGTQMHLITFLFICIETVILFYLLIYRLARPDDKITLLNVILIGVLILYNLTGGLYPDSNLPGSYHVQTSIAYATGFMTPCYFPYYVYHAFELKKMKFHAYKGVFIFLMLPYLIFVLVFVVSGKLAAAKNLLVVPVLYALWVIITLVGAVRSKYSNDFSTASAKEEMAVTFFSLTPWVGLPIIDYFNFGQQIEAATTNTGFLLLLSLQMKQHITKLKNERQRLVESEENLRNWNEKLKDEVEKRTKEIEQISMEQRIKESCARYGLTPRETQISVMICRGQSYKQIAEKLYISERTATKHAQNIFDKTKVSNKLELLNKLNITATG